jgi:hypothetical protein
MYFFYFLLFVGQRLRYLNFVETPNSSIPSFTTFAHLYRVSREICPLHKKNYNTGNTI